RIVIRVYETSDDMANALTSGEVDLIWRGLETATAATLEDVDNVVVQSVPAGTLHFLTVNHALAPTDQLEVRRALAELIDRMDIIESVLGGAFVPAFSPVPPGYVGSSEPYLDLYGAPDVEQSIGELTTAGYTVADPAQIELAYPPERFGLDIAPAMEALVLQIEATGLVEVTLTAQAWETYVGDVVDGAYNIALLGWQYDYPDPDNYLAPFVLDGGLGGSGETLQGTELAGLVAEAATELDPELRTELYEEIQTKYAEDVVTIPLWTEQPYIAYSTNVSGSEELESPESLNIGSTLQLDFRAVDVTDRES
ncbi:MAG TPA: ABC transporter substrate-binding protein, partial [Acidimicrobiia bacterium]|nr:ABC transporter substrate-binding protein [Acidimicrobiia bacterium]